MSKLTATLREQLKPLIDAKKNVADIKGELVGQIKLMSKSDNSKMKESRELQLNMVDALRDVQEVSEAIGKEYRLSNKEIADAYGKSPAWVSRTFKVASDGEQRTAYIAGTLSITGNQLGDKKENRIKEAHLILIEEKRPISARILCTESGESLEDCIKYLEAFIGSLEAQGEKVKKGLLSFFDFTPQTVDGKPDTSKVSDDGRIGVFSGIFADMMQGKEANADVIRRAFQTTLNKLGYKVVREAPKQA